MKKTLLIFHFVMLGSWALAQQYTPKINTDSVFRALNSEIKKGGNAPRTSLRDSPYLNQSSDSLKKAYETYLIFEMKNNQANFEWNLKSTKIIFWMVIFLVFSGILFSGVQFYKATLEKKIRSKSPDQNQLNTEIEANLKGIKISTPILGVIILVISLAFFYLYLIYVYPIIQI